MYRRPKFLETLIEVRQAMALEADYDVDLFTETARSGAAHAPAAKRKVPTEEGTTAVPAARTRRPRRR